MANEELTMLEARARAAESRATLLASKAASNDAYQEDAERAQSELRELQVEIDRIGRDPLAGYPEPSGTKPAMSDNFGNFSTNLEVVGAGGIGVTASNSKADGSPATNADEAVSMTPEQEAAAKARQAAQQAEDDAYAAVRKNVEAGKAKLAAAKETRPEYAAGILERPDPENEPDPAPSSEQEVGKSPRSKPSK